ncbi:hypothetical protein [Niallia taxi]|uniref:hypothetical protein n=1 Tax=Niallia taxi TaxID=2499688 RepID=UPI00300AE28A
MQTINNMIDSISEKGILKITGRSMSFQIVIGICSKPKVRKIPAAKEKTALNINPIYNIKRTGIASR